MFTGSANVQRTPPPFSSDELYFPNTSTSTIAIPSPAPRSASEQASDAPATPPPMINVWTVCIGGRLYRGTGRSTTRPARGSAASRFALIASSHPAKKARSRTSVQERAVRMLTFWCAAWLRCNRKQVGDVADHIGDLVQQASEPAATEQVAQQAGEQVAQQPFAGHGGDVN